MGRITAADAVLSADQTKMDGSWPNLNGRNSWTMQNDEDFQTFSLNFNSVL